MDLASAGLTEQPFRTHGEPIVTVPYESNREALKSLRQVLTVPDGLALLQGPALAGKSTIVREFIETLDAECAVAHVDGNGLNATQLLESILRQFGYVLDYNSDSELFGMLRIFAMQQATRHEAPLVIVDNAHALRASALRALSELAELSVRQATAVRASAIKLVLVSDHSLLSIASEDLLAPITKRTTADVHIQPMSPGESTDFLHRKLSAAGASMPEYVLPSRTCRALHEASGGWPGILDRLALLAIAKAPALPIPVDRVEHPVVPEGTRDEAPVAPAELEVGAPPEPPKLIVSKNGKTVQAMTFDMPRLLIGRSEHNDIPIPSRFVSRHHLLLVGHGGSTFLMDLNSTNGTLVNSRRVSNQVLNHGDVVSIGNHSIKFYDPHATSRSTLDGPEFADTAIMKTLDDMRKLLAQENTEILPAASGEKA